MFACKREKFFICGFRLGTFHPEGSPLKNKEKKALALKMRLFFLLFFFLLFLIPL